LGDYELGIASPQVVYALLEGFVALQVLGAWVVDLAEVGFGFTGYYGVNRHRYREDWGCFSYRLSGGGGCSRRLFLDGLPGPPHRSSSPTVACGSLPLRFSDSRGTVRFCLWRNSSRSCLVLRLVGRVCLGALPMELFRIVGMLTAL